MGKPVHGADNSPMRIDLKVPFAEKDTAKALGARWDAAKRIWYVKDVSDLTPFSRWISVSNVDQGGATRGTTPKATTTGNVAVGQTVGAVTGPAVVAPHCGCDVQPWEDCEHTVKA